MSNVSENAANIKKFRAELEAALEDVADIDKRVLQKGVNTAVREAKILTPVGVYPGDVEFVTKDGKQVKYSVKKRRKGGHLRRNWFASKVVKSSGGISSTVYNNVDYAIPVNNGHRVKNKDGKFVGYVKGKYMMEKAVIKAEKAMSEEYKKAITEVKQKYDL